MMHFWGAFALATDPNAALPAWSQGSGTAAAAGCGVWPPYEDASRLNMVLQLPLGSAVETTLNMSHGGRGGGAARAGGASGLCQFWDKIGYQQVFA